MVEVRVKLSLSEVNLSFYITVQPKEIKGIMSVIHDIVQIVYICTAKQFPKHSFIVILTFQAAVKLINSDCIT